MADIDITSPNVIIKQAKTFFTMNFIWIIRSIDFFSENWGRFLFKYKELEDSLVCLNMGMFEVFVWLCEGLIFSSLQDNSHRLTTDEFPSLLCWPLQETFTRRSLKSYAVHPVIQPFYTHVYICIYFNI